MAQNLIPSYQIVMMRSLKLLVPGLLFTITTFAQNAQVISECIVQYDLSMDETKADPEIVKSFRGATKTIYIKGTRSRSDLVSPTYVQTILTDTNSDTAVVLTERGNTKLMSYLTGQKRKDHFKRYEGITFTATNETKTILAYDCNKLIGKLKDGSTISVYYAPSVVPSNKEFEYQFKDIPGFVFEYETPSENGKSNIRYTATKITKAPIPASKFDAPKTGYRLL